MWCFIEVLMRMRFLPILLLMFFSFTVSCKTTTEEPQSTPAPSSTLSPQTNQSVKAEIVRARIVPVTTANGKPAHELLIDWKNTGTMPIFVVKAKFSIYTSKGDEIERMSQNSYTIFVSEKAENAIKPGEIYREPSGSGHFLLNVPPETRMPAKVKAQLIWVSAVPPASE